MRKRLTSNGPFSVVQLTSGKLTASWKEGLSAASSGYRGGQSLCSSWYSDPSRGVSVASWHITGSGPTSRSTSARMSGSYNRQKI